MKKNIINKLLDLSKRRNEIMTNMEKTIYSCNSIRDKLDEIACELSEDFPEQYGDLYLTHKKCWNTYVDALEIADRVISHSVDYAYNVLTGYEQDGKSIEGVYEDIEDKISDYVMNDYIYKYVIRKMTPRDDGDIEDTRREYSPVRIEIEDMN